MTGASRQMWTTAFALYAAVRKVRLKHGRKRTAGSLALVEIELASPTNWSMLCKLTRLCLTPNSKRDTSKRVYTWKERESIQQQTSYSREGSTTSEIRPLICQGNYSTSSFEGATVNLYQMRMLLHWRNISRGTIDTVSMEDPTMQSIKKSFAVNWRQLSHFFFPHSPQTTHWSGLCLPTKSGIFPLKVGITDAGDYLPADGWTRGWYLWEKGKVWATKKQKTLSRWAPPA